MLLQIQTGTKNDLLRQVSDPVDTFDDALVTLVENMEETMHTPDPETGIAGVGIAAPQVGILKRIVLITLGLDTKKSQKTLVMINPEITDFSKDAIKMEEGCLSLPNVFEQLVRPTKIRARWQDLQGRWHEKKFGGWEAREIQHEVDHLDGVLFVDHLGK